MLARMRHRQEHDVSSCTCLSLSMCLNKLCRRELYSDTSQYDTTQRGNTDTVSTWFWIDKKMRQKTETEKCTAVILGFARRKCWYSITKRPGDMKYYHVVIATWSQENIKCPCDCLAGTGEVNPSSGHRPSVWRKMLCAYLCHSTTGAVLDSSFMDHYIIPYRYLSSSLETVFAVTCWFGTVSWEVITRCSDAATNTSL